jgi:V/A-type H+-transporting ATPase subunit K
VRATRGRLLCAATVGCLLVLGPELALAAEAATESAPAAEAWQVGVGQAIGAAITMSVCAWAAGYAQSKIGAAGAGTLAERPEVATTLIVLQALPEIIALLGFAIAFMIIGA